MLSWIKATLQKWAAVAGWIEVRYNDIIAELQQLRSSVLVLCIMRTIVEVHRL